jgi:uncharacterized protein YgbK (DUF1537 family)
MALLLGCIADDFTGATDLANTLVRKRHAHHPVIGVPDGLDVPAEAEAIVVALKSRTARSRSGRAIGGLLPLAAPGGRAAGLFQICSTFDSTDQGNIGPVADALRAELGVDFAYLLPGVPETGRYIYNGHLFVGDVLLSDSSMRNHPLTPMTDANLVRVLGRQTKARSASCPMRPCGRERRRSAPPSTSCASGTSPMPCRRDRGRGPALPWPACGLHLILLS